MRNLIYRGYCLIHKGLKRLLRPQKAPSYRMVSVDGIPFSSDETLTIEGPFINDVKISGKESVSKSYLFPVENIVPVNSNRQLPTSFQNSGFKASTGKIMLAEAPDLWRRFVESSKIPKGYKNEGLHYAGFIGDYIGEWCLPSWVWTNAALVRLYCGLDQVDHAKKIGDILLSQQLDCGGWVVRNDYTSRGAIPVLAPNDSAYIANNCFVELYRKTKDSKYVKAAKNCADWIIDTAREDGLVWTGFDMETNTWLKEYVIVDTGFTAGLFANLYAISKEERYLSFLKKFTSRFIALFFDADKNNFSTSLNSDNKRHGGVFGRGQAWALEGLIPAYKVLKSHDLKIVIESVISYLIKKQHHDGGWAYNFSKPLLGDDCKGIPVIAKNIMDWHKIYPKSVYEASAKKGLLWSVNHTYNSGIATGGIFSFCMEGAVVHNFYTETAFVYSSAYALELYDALNL